jgi:hypothetical protein
MAELTPAREARLREAVACVDGAGAAGASVKDVADCLQIKVGPHLRGLLEQLVELNILRKEDGVLIKTNHGYRTGARYYGVPGQS